LELNATVWDFRLVRFEVKAVTFDPSAALWPFKAVIFVVNPATVVPIPVV
jgi:hypothetical protein